MWVKDIDGDLVNLRLCYQIMIYGKREVQAHFIDETSLVIFQGSEIECEKFREKLWHTLYAHQFPGIGE